MSAMLPINKLHLSVTSGVLSLTTWGNAVNQPLLLLHGFMQKGTSWQAVAEHFAHDYFVIAPDLPGHGETVVVENEQGFALGPTAQVIAEALGQLTHKPCVVAGYSLGGRIATYLLRDWPAHLKAVVLESAGLGITNEAERIQRLQKTNHQIETLEKAVHDRAVFSKFIDTWEALPLFASQRNLSASIQKSQRFVRLNNNPHLLALSLRFAGQHAMDNMRDILRIRSQDFPLLYMAGSLDAAYSRIAQSLQTIPGLSVEVVQGVGHNIHLENRSLFCIRIESFLRDAGLQKGQT